jgi:hypothetical protein
LHICCSALGRDWHEASDPLRCGNADAIGGRADIGEAVDRVDPTPLTLAHPSCRSDKIIQPIANEVPIPIAQFVSQDLLSSAPKRQCLAQP